MKYCFWVPVFLAFCLSNFIVMVLLRYLIRFILVILIAVEVDRALQRT